ncbi:MAG: hypothetical protein IPM76_16695 [Chloroflexi bacterium]|nr:hypothetical protein [Chloroflexota bacterium]
MNATAVTLTPYTDSQSHLLAALALLDLRVQWAIARARANGLQPDDDFRGLYISDDHADALLKQGIGGHLWANATATAVTPCPPTFLPFWSRPGRNGKPAPRPAAPTTFSCALII